MSRTSISKRAGIATSFGIPLSTGRWQKRAAILALEGLGAIAI